MYSTFHFPSSITNLDIFSQLLFVWYIVQWVKAPFLYYWQWSSSSSTEKPLTFIIGVNSNSIENGYGGVLIINNVMFPLYWTRLHPENKFRFRKLMKTWYNMGFIIDICNI